MVNLRGGLTTTASALRVLWDLENRGFAFEVSGGRFRVVPAANLSPADVAAIREQREALLALVRYQPDDSHLFSDQRATA